MLISHHSSGDFKVVSEFPLNLWDIQKIVRRIHFDHLTNVQEWPIITELDDAVDYWVYWFVSPEIDSSYLDHEVLF